MALMSKTYYYYSAATSVKPERVNALKIYPNPFSEVACLEIPEGEIPIRIELYDISGRRLSILNEITGNRIRIDRSGLLPGTYILKVKGKNLYSGKILIK